jgi:hypothetical protein
MSIVASKGVKMEAEETTKLEAVTKQRLMKTQQIEKTNNNGF